ncbi:MAG TPA: hypothetical protein VFR67_01335 [Pilimelia sp.]|nr:hypothetical protein [Pilimelia sp.]
MPERARIFTLSETVARALADMPALSGRVHRFDKVTDLALPPGGLFVARMPPEAWYPPGMRQLGPGVVEVGGGRQRAPAFEREEAWGPGRPGVDFVEAWSRFGWLEGVWPPAACLRRLRALASSAHPLAYYHDMEGGDDLYYAFGWLAGVGEELVVQQTFLVNTEDVCTIAFREEAAPAARESVLEAVLVHLGLAPTIQFFWPEDELRGSDWPPFE